MQFHLDGYMPGDPDIADAATREHGPGAAGVLPAEVDVLIIGCGPAGLTLAAQLSAFADLKTCIVDQRAGRLLRGQADGVACRTMEMFNAFGFAERVLREAYWVNETAFWRPDDVRSDEIVRSGRIEDTEPGLSEFPHVILNQARVHDFFLDVMRKQPAQIEPYYNARLALLVVDETLRGRVDAHAVTATFDRTDAKGEARTESVKARFVVGCDGARSSVRGSIGLALRGESANHAWGVMDVLAVTDFPDIRLKAVIQSRDQGSIVLIPREGGYLARIYVEMDELAENERVKNRDIVADDLIAATQRILRPYAFDVRDIAWWSVYEIGQRLCDRFDDAGERNGALPRVFIAGDACHTHSPKAGQGMNVSMQDAFNLGWKLAAVLRGRARPSLLASYSTERHAIARELIDFDRQWSQMLMSKSEAEADPAEVQAYFVRHGRYTAGTATRYEKGLLTGPTDHQHLAPGFAIGTRLHSAPVVRLADAKPMHLGHAIQADGRWRLLCFADAGDPSAPGSAIARLCDWLTDPAALVAALTPAGADPDAILDVRVIFQQDHRTLAVERMPPALLPRKGRFGLRDYEKMFCPDLSGGRDIFDLREIDRARGCLVLVRPDQYVAHILPLDGYVPLTHFFADFLIAASGRALASSGG